MSSDQLRREALDAIQRSGAVLEQSDREQKKIRETLDESEEIDRRRRQPLLRRVGITR